MPKVTKAAALNKGLNVVEHGTPKKKRTQEPFKQKVENQFYGKLDKQFNYRDLPTDDPLRIHIEKLTGER